MGKSKFSMEFKKSVCEYATDHNYADTSAKYGITTKSVQNWRKSLGYPRPTEGRSVFATGIKHEACQYYETHTGDETVAKFGVSKPVLSIWRRELGYRNKHRGYNLYTEALQPTVTKRERRNFMMTRSENGQLKAELQQRDERITSLEERLTQLEGASTLISQLKQLLN